MSKVKTEPGPRKAQMMAEKTHGEVFLEKVINSNDKYEILGDECDLNMVASPYTYIAKDRVVAFVTGAVSLYRDILRANPERLLELRTVAREKLHTFQTVVRTHNEALEKSKIMGS